MNDASWELGTDDCHLHLLEYEGDVIDKVAMKIPGNGFDGKVVLLEGGKCKSAASLLKEFNERFFFPDYFGFNFEGLDECLNDLEWLESKKYLVFIRDIDKVLPDDFGAFKDFIMILEDTVKEWNHGRHYGAQHTPPTPFDVVFLCEKNLLANELRLKSSGMKDLNVISAPL